MATDEFEVHFKVTYDEITRRRTMRLPSEHTFEALHNEVALMFGLTGPAVLCCKGQLLLTDDDVKAAISEKNIRLQILGVMSLNMLPSCKLKEAEPEAPEPEPEAPTAPEPEAPADEPEAPAPEAPEPTPEAPEPEASAPAPSAPASASLAEASVIVAPPLRPTAPAFTPTTPRAATSIPPAAPGNPWADMARAAPPAYPGDRWRDYPSLTDAFPPVTTAPGHRCQTCAAVFRNRKGLHRHIRHTHGQTLPLVSRPPTVKDSDVGQLITMGFNARYAREALRQSNGDFDAALELLLSGTLEA